MNSDLIKSLERQVNEAIKERDQVIRQYQAQQKAALKLRHVARIVFDLLLTRSGEIITPEVAMERARNIAQALAGQTIEE